MSFKVQKQKPCEDIAFGMTEDEAHEFIENREELDHFNKLYIKNNYEVYEE